MAKGQWRAGHILKESVSCQKHLTKLYNSAALEADNDHIRQDFLSILDEEHQLHRDLFLVLQRRGLHSPRPAEKHELARAQENFSNYR
ncbi:MAG: spore coat protein [Bacillota bacterium]|jgi:spore coat protein F